MDVPPSKLVRFPLAPAFGYLRIRWIFLRAHTLLFLCCADDPSVLALFTGNPFAAKPPLEVRAVLWQYGFTDAAERQKTEDWLRRKLIGLYAPVLQRAPAANSPSSRCWE